MTASAVPPNLLAASFSLAAWTIHAHRAPIPEEDPLPGESPSPDEEEPPPHPDPVLDPPNDPLSKPLIARANKRRILRISACHNTDCSREQVGRALAQRSFPVIRIDSN